MLARICGLSPTFRKPGIVVDCPERVSSISSVVLNSSGPREVDDNLSQLVSCHLVWHCLANVRRNFWRHVRRKAQQASATDAIWSPHPRGKAHLNVQLRVVRVATP